MIFRRSGLRMKDWPTKIQPSASNSSIMPIMTPRMLSSGGRRRCLRGAELSLRGAAAGAVSVATGFVPVERPAALLRRELHDSDLGGVLAINDAGHAAFVHHGDTVAHAQNLRQLRGDHQHRDALAGEF